MSKREEIQDILTQRGVLRAQELAEYGISPEYLNQLADEGLVERLARGVYASLDYATTEYLDLVIVQKRVPDAVFCLLTALQFHNLTTQLPSEVYISLKRSQRRPELEWPPVIDFKISSKQFYAGIQEHQLKSGPTLRVYSPARTVVDCFKFRNQIGLDVAIEALRDTSFQRKATVDEILEFAEICRVKNVLRPYLEATI